MHQSATVEHSVSKLKGKPSYAHKFNNYAIASTCIQTISYSRLVDIVHTNNVRKSLVHIAAHSMSSSLVVSFNHIVLNSSFVHALKTAVCRCSLPDQLPPPLPPIFFRGRAGP